MRLRNRLRNEFDNWSRNYNAGWSAVLQSVEPDAYAVPWSSTVSSAVPLIPPPHDFQSSLVWNELHTMRALDRVLPADVKVVILGQDPYPRRRQATGRAFEQGDFSSWSGDVAYGLKHIIQRLAQHRSGDDKYRRGDDAWYYVKTDASTLGLPSVRELYDSWEDQGVLFLNFVLTYTLPKHVFTAHAPFWRPVVTALLRHLATRPSRRIVFATCGVKTGQFFAGAGVLKAASDAGTYPNCRVLGYNHPSARPWGNLWAPFLRSGNIFGEINDKLRDLGESEITW